MTSEENKRAYARYVEILNARDFAQPDEVVDPGRHEEIRAGPTPGWVGPEEP